MDMETGPIREWMPAIIGGVVSLFVLIITVLSTRSVERTKIAAEHDKQTRIDTARLREAEIVNDAHQAQDLTARFRTLLEGYESRIRDLTTDLATLKAEDRLLHKLYDERTNMCNSCPYYLEHRKATDARQS